MTKLFERLGMDSELGVLTKFNMESLKKHWDDRYRIRIWNTDKGIQHELYVTERGLRGRTMIMMNLTEEDALRIKEELDLVGQQAIWYTLWKRKEDIS